MTNRAMNFFTVCLYILFCIIALPISALASPLPSFECNVSPHPALKRNGYDVGQFIYYGDAFVAFTAYPSNALDKLPRVVSGSGEQFSDGKLTFHSKGDQAILSVENGPVFKCQSQASQVLAQVTSQATSLETIVRSGPSVNASRIEKLPLNEPLELIGQSGKYYQDFQWFKIRYGEGQEGYAWGGTLCVETELSGILIGCARFLQSIQNNTPQSSGKAYAIGQSLFGSKVRAQPSASARQMFSITQGTPIQVLQETGSFFDGWQWVKISSANDIGFVWGGTICTSDRQLTGVHFGCN